MDCVSSLLHSKYVYIIINFDVVSFSRQSPWQQKQCGIFRLSRVSEIDRPLSSCEWLKCHNKKRIWRRKKTNKSSQQYTTSADQNMQQYSIETCPFNRTDNLSNYKNKNKNNLCDQLQQQYQVFKVHGTSAKYLFFFICLINAIWFKVI